MVTQVQSMVLFNAIALVVAAVCFPGPSYDLYRQMTGISAETADQLRYNTMFE